MKKLVPRKFDRVCHVREVTFRVGDAGHVRRGNTVDVSPKGVRLFSPQAIPVGETIDLTWPNRQPPLTIGGRVVHNKVETEGSLVGVLFHHPLSADAYDSLRKT